MPEIKHQFTGGKMNKDVDERLVPNGEYRDAMNIQVSTSEGSDVGAVQNILGNTFGCTDYASDPSLNPIPTNSFVVGSVADEGNDSLYWLISGESYSPDNMVENNDWNSGVVTMKDLIFKKAPNECEPVFVDIFAFSQPHSDNSNQTTLSGVSLEILNQLQVGWTVTGVTDLGLQSNEVTIVDLGSAQNNYIPVTFESTAVATATNTVSFVGNSAHAVASGIWIPAFPLFNGGYAQQNSNFIYINGFNGTPSSLIGDTIEILPYAVPSQSQTFTISNAATVSVTSNGFGLNVVKVTLDGNLANFTTPLDQPSSMAAGTTPHPYIATAGGSVINALITSQNVVAVDVATGELTIAVSDFDVANVTVGETVYKDNTAYCVQSINTGNNSITLENCNTHVIHDGWQVGGMIYGVPQFTGGSIVIQSQIQVQLDTSLNLSNDTYTSLLYRGPRTLNFNHNNYITGINIIDDMLFWTDGLTEPKKINIPRSIEGSNSIVGVKGFEHTRLINESQDISIWDNVLVREEHITVIKKAPLSAPSINFSTDARDSVTSGASVAFTLDIAANTVGQTKTMVADESFYGFEEGDIIRLAPDTNLLPRNYDIRVEIITINALEYTVKILTLSENADVSNIFWFGELESIGDFLFERKLPRFAYRYKYLDNEYSSFSPFTNVAFFPGQFNYEPIVAYNLGMQNSIKTLRITDFITPELPKDVKSIDLLYKNETSPIIYLLETISNNDELILGENSWNSIGTHDIQNSSSGSYKVKTESISQALPSNQSLRSWDNVPKRALAQEISGNRVIYANYSQGYDIINNSGKIITPSISTVVVSDTIDTGGNIASKSIKSLRNYEVGVVWGDKYGRETPVITSKSGSVLVPKSRSKTNNHLKVSLDSSPNWADYYRFYIKETSNEYYNLAVDRIYDADDGNIWVSFPSVDRNKVDIETYLILKKGVDSEELVEQEGRYKVVAIENDAPDYIKTSFDLIVRTNQDETHSTHSCNFWGGLNNATTGCTVAGGLGNLNPPNVGRKSFSISTSRWGGTYSTTNKYMQLPDLIDLFKEVTSNAETVNNEMYVSFTQETTTNGVTNVLSGDKYHVVDIRYANDSDEDQYVVYLEKPIGLKDEFVVQGTPASSSGIQLQNDGIHTIFWQKSVTNKPEFDGRFFVKILNDSTAQDNLSRESATLNQWIIAAETNLYKIEDTALDTSGNVYNFSSASMGFDDATYNNAPGQSEMNSAFGTLNHRFEWLNALEFGTGFASLQSRWFIDNAPFAGIHSGGSAYFTAFTDNTVSALPVTSCDTSSLFYINSGPSGVNTTFGTGASFGRVGMKGIHTTASGNYIDLSFSQLLPDAPPEQSGSWDIGNPATNTYMEEEKSIVDRLVINSRFKLTGGEGIFKIKGITKRRLLNVTGAPTIEINGALLAGTIGMTQSALKNTPQAVAQRQNLGRAWNKRFSYRIKYELDENASPLIVGTPDFSLADEANYNPSTGAIVDYKVDNITNTVPSGIQFLKEFLYDSDNKISSNPAVFETEPKEDVGLDLYYEASSSLPVFPLNNKNKYLFMPLGTTVVSPYGTSFPEGVFITQWNSLTPASERVVSLSSPISPTEYSELFGDNGFVQFLRDDGTYVTATLTRDPSTVFATQYELAITPKNEFGLNWHNCWSFNNGVESNRIGDTFNKPYLSNGVTLSTTAKDSPGEENRRYGLIYSGIYNSSSGVNSLNQFIAAEKITKDINPTFGSIQKLHAGWGQSGSLIALCEDRVLNILANKDALFNADGNPQLTATNKVLGSTTPYAGEFGISKNPESFASQSHRIYFTDKVRGAVVRLSMDGLTSISDHGMKDWFRDNLKLNQFLIGSFDDKKDEYNITLKQVVEAVSFPEGTTVSFKEDVRGWVSFKSFTPENAISCANEYYTFNNGLLWKHHDESEDRNTFYKGYPSSGFTPSSINVILNDQPGIIKTFHTLNYEGSQSKVDSFTSYDVYFPGTTIPKPNGNVYNNEYYNISSKPGWKVQHIQTDLEQGSLNEFIKKEGKWFNYIKGKAGSVVDPGDSTIISGSISSGFDNADFSFQGIGSIIDAPDITSVFGCTANGLDLNATGNVNDQFGDGVAAFNYNPLAMIDDGACIQTIYGCTASAGVGYDPLANVDDFSCTYSGCTDVLSYGFNPNLGYPVDPVGSYIFIDDGSCVAPIYGCMVSGMLNYDGLANTACDGSLVANGSQPCESPATGPNCCCVPYVYGCMITTADNYDPLANTDDPTNPCNTNVYGCPAPSACNWYGTVPALTTLVDDGSCVYCADPSANNYDGLNPDGDPYGCANNNGCLACKDIITLQQVSGGGNQDTTIDVSWDETWLTNAPVDYYELRYSSDSGSTYNYITNIQPNVSQGTIYQSISGLTSNTPYTIEVKAVCSAGTSLLNPLHNTESGWGLILSVATVETQVTGCTDSMACNFDPLANNGNPSQLCEYVSCLGCTNPIATNYDASATQDDGLCTYINGCTDNTAFNYDPTATFDDGSCAPYVYGCLDDSLNNSGSTYAATNYAGPNTQGIASYTPPTPTVNTVCNDNGMNNDCCQYIMPTFHNAQIDPTWGGAGLLNTNGWGSTALWGNSGVNEQRKIFAFWDVSLSPKVILTNTAGNPRTLYAYENENGSGSGLKSGDITSFNMPSAWKFKTVTNPYLQATSSTANFNSENGIDNLEIIAFERSVYSGRVFFGEHPEWYPPNSGTGAHQQAAKFEFWENHIAAYTPNTQTYNVTLGCNDPSAGVVGGYNGEPPFFDNSLCVYTNGCMDATACNYDALANVDDGSCEYCGDDQVNALGELIAENYDDASCNTGCIYCATTISASSAFNLLGVGTIDWITPINSPINNAPTAPILEYSWQTLDINGDVVTSGTIDSGITPGGVNSVPFSFVANPSVVSFQVWGICGGSEGPVFLFIPANPN